MKWLRQVLLLVLLFFIALLMLLSKEPQLLIFLKPFYKPQDEGRPPLQCIIPDPELEKKVMTVWTKGRLGNLMGQYVTLWALAKINGYQPCINQKMANELYRYFDRGISILSSSLQLDWKVIKLHDWMDEEYRNITGEYVQLTGYPCSWTFFHHERQNVIRLFHFRSYLLQGADSILWNILQKHQKRKATFVGVHVRRGDYVKIMRDAFFGVMADSEYFKEAMNYFRKKFNNVIFIVASNGLNWCRDNLDFSFGDIELVGNNNENDPAQDLAILTRCNHSIITMGTFSFWSAYLTGGEVIYFTNFTLPQSKYLTFFKYEKAYLPEWIGIAANLSKFWDPTGTKLQSLAYK